VEELGIYRELGPPARLVADVVFVGMLFLTALLERVQLQLKATESSTWWASSGRDVVNAFALLSMALGLKVIGFAAPIAFVVAATLVLSISALQSSFSNHRVSRGITMVAALVLGLPVIVAPNFVHALFRRTLELLFGSG
jgi:hypothetical protein